MKLTAVPRNKKTMDSFDAKSDPWLVGEILRFFPDMNVLKPHWINRNGKLSEEMAS